LLDRRLSSRNGGEDHQAGAFPAFFLISAYRRFIASEILRLAAALIRFFLAGAAVELTPTADRAIVVT
jgi:hypothetical protein